MGNTIVNNRIEIPIANPEIPIADAYILEIPLANAYIVKDVREPSAPPIEDSSHCNDITYNNFNLSDSSEEELAIYNSQISPDLHKPFSPEAYNIFFSGTDGEGYSQPINLCSNVYRSHYNNSPLNNPLRIMGGMGGLGFST
jgi:hypothetical protein